MTERQHLPHRSPPARRRYWLGSPETMIFGGLMMLRQFVIAVVSALGLVAAAAAGVQMALCGE
ncbi:hypothetical protein [Nocardia brasiliensis]